MSAPDAAHGAIDLHSSVTTDTSSVEATFTFTSDVTGATFRCQLDDAEAAACGSPTALTALADGPHRFVVSLASDPEVTAAFAWNVDTHAPTLTLTAAPAVVEPDLQAAFAFATDEPTTCACGLDGAAPAACTSPWEVTVTAGAHAVWLQCEDAAGNVSNEVSHAWTAGEQPGCGPDQDVDVDTPAALEPYLGCSELGSLRLRGAVFTSVEFPNLARVSGPINVTASALTALRMPALVVASDLTVQAPLTELALPVLREVGACQISLSNLETLSLPALETATGLNVATNYMLTAVAVPELVTVTNALIIGGGFLAAIDLPSLQTVGTLSSSFSDALQSITAPMLETAEDIGIYRAGITHLTMPALRHVANAFSVSFVPALTTIDVASLETCGAISLGYADLLPGIALPNLTTLNDLTLATLPQFASIALPALAPPTNFEFSRLPLLTTFPTPGGGFQGSGVSLQSTGIGALDVGDATAMTSIVTTDCVALAYVHADRLEAVSGDVSLYNSDALTSVRLPRLASAARVRIIDSDVLSELRLDALTTVSNAVVLSNMPLVPQIDLPALTSAPQVWVQEIGQAVAIALPQLVSVDWLKITNRFRSNAATLDIGQLLTVGGEFTISTPSPQMLTEITHLSSIGLRLDIQDAAAGTYQFGGLALSGDLWVTVRSNAVTTMAFPMITTLTSVSAQGLSNSMIALPALEQVDQGVTIDTLRLDAPRLTTIGAGLRWSDVTQPIAALPALASVGGDLAFTGSFGTETLSFSNLAAIGGSLTIWGNTFLETVEVPALSSVVGSVAVYQNDRLCDFVPEATLAPATYLFTPGASCPSP